MPSTRTFSDVTAEILTRMKEFGRAEYGIVYDPPEGPINTATSQTPLSECVIEFVHDPGKGRIDTDLGQEALAVAGRSAVQRVLGDARALSQGTIATVFSASRH